MVVPSYPFGSVQLLTHCTVQLCFSVPIYLYQFTIIFLKSSSFTGSSCGSNSAQCWKQRSQFSQSGKVNAPTSPVTIRKASNSACDQSSRFRNLSSILGWCTTQWHNLQTLQYHGLHTELLFLSVFWLYFSWGPKCVSKHASGTPCSHTRGHRSLPNTPPLSLLVERKPSCRRPDLAYLSRTLDRQTLMHRSDVTRQPDVEWHFVG